MIYFIRSPDGPIKIGTTVRLTERLKQLVAEFGSGLEVLAVTEGSVEAEREIHERFGHLRTVGEWFEPGDDLLGFIVAEGKPWDGSDDTPCVPLSIKMTPAFRDWLAEVAAAQRITTVQFLERAAVEEARRLKHPTPAPKRTVR